MSKKHNSGIGLFNALIILALIITWIFIGTSCQSCEDKGGHYVRGVMWYECIGADE